MTSILFVLEWENADGLEREEALGFLDGLSDRLADFVARNPGLDTRMTVIFDGTPDAALAADIRKRAEGAFPGNRLLLLGSKGIPYYNKKQVAAAKSPGDIIVLCDSDCVYSEDWLDEIINPLLTGDADLCFGQTYADKGNSTLERASALAWFFPLRDVGDPRQLEEREAPLLRANNCAFTREVLTTCPIPIHSGSRSHGGMWRRKIEAAGLRALYRPGAWNEHKQFDSLLDFYARAILLGRDRAIGLFLHPKGPWPRERVYQRAREDFMKEVRFFRNRFDSPALAALTNDPAEARRIRAYGLSFGFLVGLSRLVYSITLTPPTVSDDYTEFETRVTPVPLPPPPAASAA